MILTSALWLTVRNMIYYSKECNVKITNLSAEPIGKLHSWIPHDLEAEQVVFLPDACPG